MASSKSITFYDIASAKPSRTFAPNPWKTRFALNFKKASYSTQWIDLPNISSLRKELGISANRTLPDGEPFSTLPIIKDESSGKIVGDSFEIALYLDSTYPDAPRLIRTHTTGLVASLNARVDGIFTRYAILCDQMPFPARSVEATLAIFAKRASAMSTDLQQSNQQRAATFTSLENDLGELAKAYRHTGGTTDYFWRVGGTAQAQQLQAPAGHEQVGPWLDDDGPSYADFIIGAWLKMFEAAMRPEGWERVRGFQGGLWGRIVDALEPYSQIV